jgi:hypothetical protein
MGSFLNRIRSIRAILLGCCFFGLFASAQMAQVLPEFGTHIAFNGGDFNWGGQLGMDIAALDLSIRADFTGRAGAKRVLVESPSNNNVLIQYREARYLLGIEAEKRFPIKEFESDALIGVTGMLLGGYTFGDYRGTKTAPYNGATYRARIAPYLLLDEAVLVRAGYEYLPTRTEDVANHRVFIAITIIIPTE